MILSGLSGWRMFLLRFLVSLFFVGLVYWAANYWTVENGADIVMLDNMSSDEVKRVIDELNNLNIRQNSLIEVSGGVTDENIMDYVDLGVDIISIGALTHSSRSLNFSLRFD